MIKLGNAVHSDQGRP